MSPGSSGLYRSLLYEVAGRHGIRRTLWNSTENTKLKAVDTTFGMEPDLEPGEPKQAVDDTIGILAYDNVQIRIKDVSETILTSSRGTAGNMFHDPCNCSSASSRLWQSLRSNTSTRTS